MVRFQEHRWWDFHRSRFFSLVSRLTNSVVTLNEHYNRKVLSDSSLPQTIRFHALELVVLDRGILCFRTYADTDALFPIARIDESIRHYLQIMGTAAHVDAYTVAVRPIVANQVLLEYTTMGPAKRPLPIGADNSSLTVVFDSAANDMVVCVTITYVDAHVRVARTRTTFY